MTIDEQIASVRDELLVNAVALQGKLEFLIQDLRAGKLRRIDSQGVTSAYGVEIDSLTRFLFYLMEMKGQIESPPDRYGWELSS